MDLIYEDLDVHPNIDEEYAKVQAVNKELSKKISLLDSEISRLTDSAKTLKKRQEDLERNISSLYNTARAELERKDKRISELQRKLDDLLFRRSSCPDKDKSDSSRQGSHTSRSASPAPKEVNKDIRQRRVSPRKTKNPYDGGNGRNASGNRDNRGRDLRDRDRAMNRRYSPPKRGRVVDRKSPPNKRPRYEHNRPNYDKDEVESAKRKRYELENDKTFKHKDNQPSSYQNKDKDLMEVTKEVDNNLKPNEAVRLNVSAEEGEIIDFIEMPKTPAVSKNNKCENKTSDNASSKNNKLDSNMKSDKNLKKTEINKFDSRCKKNENKLSISERDSQNAMDKFITDDKQLTIENIRAQKAVELEKLKAENKKFKGTTSNSDSHQSEIPNVPLVQSLKKKVKDALSQADTTAKNKTKLFAPKPPSVLSADILFNNSPLNLSKLDASQAKPINQIETSELPIATAVAPNKNVNAPSNANMNETSSNFNPNNSSITNSTQIVSNSVSSEENQPSSTINISISCNVSEEKQSRSTDSNNGDSTILSPTGIESMDVKSIDIPSTPGKDLQNVVLETGSTALTSAGRGKPRPRRRGGVVKMID